MNIHAIFWGGAILMLSVSAMSPLAACDTPTAVSAQPTSFAQDNILPAGQRLDASYALTKINELRANAGLKHLTFNERLTIAAKVHADDLAQRDAMTHIGADGSTPVTRIAATGYDAIVVGENLASGQRFFEDVLQGWLASPSHRATLYAEDVIHAGLALTYEPSSPSRTFWAMVVAEPF